MKIPTSKTDKEFGGRTIYIIERYGIMLLKILKRGEAYGFQRISLDTPARKFPDFG